MIYQQGWMVQRLGLLPGLEEKLRLDPKLDPQEGVGLLKKKIRHTGT